MRKNIIVIISLILVILALCASWYAKKLSIRDENYELKPSGDNDEINALENGLVEKTYDFYEADDSLIFYGSDRKRNLILFFK